MTIASAIVPPSPKRVPTEAAKQTTLHAIVQVQSTPFPVQMSTQADKVADASLDVAVAALVVAVVTLVAVFWQIWLAREGIRWAIRDYAATQESLQLAKDAEKRFIAEHAQRAHLVIDGYTSDVDTSLGQFESETVADALAAALGKIGQDGLRVKTLRLFVHNHGKANSVPSKVRIDAPFMGIHDMSNFADYLLMDSDELTPLNTSSLRLLVVGGKRHFRQRFNMDFTERLAPGDQHQIVYRVFATTEIEFSVPWRITADNGDVTVGTAIVSDLSF